MDEVEYIGSLGRYVVDLWGIRFESVLCKGSVDSVGRLDEVDCFLKMICRGSSGKGLGSALCKGVNLLTAWLLARSGRQTRPLSKRISFNQY